MMKKYVIIADGTCDLNEDMLREYDIKPVLGHIHLPDGSEISQFLSWKDYTREDFYNKLKKNPNGYSTSPANPEMFAAVYREYAKQGVDMLVLTMSAGMSGTYNFACAGREAVLKEFPDDLPAYVRLNVEIKNTVLIGAMEEARNIARGKNCRVCHVNVTRPEQVRNKSRMLTVQELKNIPPLELVKRYASDKKHPFDEEMEEMFKEVIAIIQQEERK